MDSLSKLKQFVGNNPIEVVRSAQITTEDKETGRPSFRLSIVLISRGELEELQFKYPDRDDNNDVGENQRREYCRALGAKCVRGWEGLTRANIEINSAWALRHPEALGQLGEAEEVPYDKDGRDFLMEILDYATIIKSLEIHVTNTAAFALEVQRARGK